MTSIIALLILVLDIFAIVRILQSSASGAEKILWILGVLVFPLIGMAVWFFAGPGNKKL
ncbi:MAG: PLD nuclease N-terminal domain-containing protein [Methylotenera sp.]